MLRGDVANGDIARADLIREYEPSLAGDEIPEGEPCYRLDLLPRVEGPRYSRIWLSVARKGFLPRKLEFYGLTGNLLRTAHYEDYRKTSLGLRSMRLRVDSPLEGRRVSTMTFSSLRKIDASALEFNRDGMIAFRDAAMGSRQEQSAAAVLDATLRALRAEATRSARERGPSPETRPAR